MGAAQDGRTIRAFFARLKGQQAPEYLWIGCSDSRVPANEIVDLDPGELFVHRNVANLAPPQDVNYLSVLQYAVDVLKVKHILVVGHYGCGGVAAAVDGERRGLVDHWLHPIREVAHDHQHELDALPAGEARLDRLCELNVLRQVRNRRLGRVRAGRLGAGTATLCPRLGLFHRRRPDHRPWESTSAAWRISSGWRHSRSNQEVTMPHLSFPNESAEYRIARNALLDAEDRACAARSRRWPPSAAPCRPAARFRKTSCSSGSAPTNGPSR